jgi:hypothetical protein
MVEENKTWGAPRIHGELLKLGFDISERTVSRYIRRLSPPGQSRKLWVAFLSNHREAITAMDFFTVPTVTFRVLYCFFVIEHGRRKILHFNVTNHPTGSWVVRQLREAFSDSHSCQYATTIQIEPMNRSARTLRQFAPSLASQIILLAYLQVPASAACITATIGNGLHNKHVTEIQKERFRAAAPSANLEYFPIFLQLQ